MVSHTFIEEQRINTNRKKFMIHTHLQHEENRIIYVYTGSIFQSNMYELLYLHLHTITPSVHTEITL